MKAQLFLTLLLPAASFAADCFGGTPKSVDSYIKRASELCHACNSPGACVNKGTAGPDNVYCAIINSHTTKYCAVGSPNY